MKFRKSFILVGFALILNSCIVKSIQPFYTVDSQFFDNRFEGKFITKDKTTWRFVPFKTKWQEENKDEAERTKEDYYSFKLYKNAYVMEYYSEDKEAFFIAMPFKVNDNLFLDLTPLKYEDSSINTIVAQHLLKTHSAAKVDFNNDGSIQLSWISESVIKRLFNDGKLRLKHEKTGFDEDLILTASSEELHNFLQKFVKSDIDDKWNKDDIITLNPNNAKP